MNHCIIPSPPCPALHRYRRFYLPLRHNNTDVFTMTLSNLYLHMRKIYFLAFQEIEADTIPLEKTPLESFAQNHSSPDMQNYAKIDSLCNKGGSKYLQRGLQEMKNILLRKSGACRGLHTLFRNFSGGLPGGLKCLSEKKAGLLYPGNIHEA